MIKINTKKNNCVFVFNSNKNKYGSVILDENDRIIDYSEKNNISNIKCSGIYFIKNLNNLLHNMKEENSIISGLIGSDIIYENTFIKLGDVDDYFESIKL